MTETVEFILDPRNPPRLTKRAKARHDAMSDEDLYYGDAPDMGNVEWKRDTAGPLSSII